MDYTLTDSAAGRSQEGWFVTTKEMLPPSFDATTVAGFKPGEKQRVK
jgi:hypothetical protein